MTAASAQGVIPTLPWHAELLREGVPVEKPPADQPWGLREMHMVDPDGNRLRICTRLPRRGDAART